jgi:superfamily II DNA/RNA helicase
MPQARTRHFGGRTRPSSPSRPGRTSFHGGGRSSRGRQPQKAYIHPSKFIQAARPRQVEESYTPQHSFEDFRVVGLIKRNLTAMHYSQPSPIQDKTIPLSLAGKDVVGIANTGTGKTAAFAVPVLNKLITEQGSKAIILAPTRELAQQIDEQFRAIGRGARVNGVLLIGGVAMGPQLRRLQTSPRIIIGTPGRVKDHLTRGSLKLADCNIVVLDEVDRMLDMGFVHDITEIISHTSEQRQNLFFSATIDPRVATIIETFSNDPVHISVKVADTSDNVDQNIVNYTAADKIDRLHDILIKDGTVKTIIFDETQRTVERLSKTLIDRGFSADAIHGGKSQSQRRRVLQKFKDSDISVLVATDVAARGLDISDITHVINYSLPQSYDDYVHRIGRTGRAGKVGHALTFVEN